jgi:ABC-2 type transport system permease protein
LLSCISAAALVYISHGIAVGNFSKDIAGSASGLSEIVIMALFGSLMTGILVCSDFESKTIHASVTRGRLAVVLSKTLIYVMIHALLLLPYMAVTLITFCTGVKFPALFIPSVFTQILYNETGAGITAGILAKIIVISLITMLVHAARLSVCIPLAFKIRKPVVVLVIGFAFDALIDLLISVLSKVELLKSVISFTPYERKYILLEMNTSAGTLIKAAICSIIFIGLMAALTYKIFKKAEIK